MSLPVTKLQWVLLSCATELGYRCWIARSRASELRTLIGITSHSRMMQTMTVSDVRVYSHLATDLHRRKGRGQWLSSAGLHRPLPKGQRDGRVAACHEGGWKDTDASWQLKHYRTGS